MHVLSIGSSVIDLFLDLDSDHFKTEGENVSLVLGDKIPSTIKKSAIGGNGANVAVGLSRLDIPTTFYTFLGNDYFSREIYEGISKEGVELEVERHDDKNSPLHIILDFPDDRVILANYSKNPHEFKPKNKDYDYVFLTSIPEEWESAYKKIIEFVKTNNIPLAFSPGTRQIENKSEVVNEVLKNTKIYFSNKEEGEKIVGASSNIQDLLSNIKTLGPEIVSITDGGNGAYAIDSSNKCYSIPPSPSEGTEKTGAGDAYACAFFAAILNNQDVPTAMKWGSLNSAGVMWQVGAQNGLLTKTELDEQLKEHDNLVAEKF